jgi:hypothetical protein
MTDGLALDQLKARRRELQDIDDAVSYVRRVAQGRADLARAELARRGGAELDLRHVLGDHLLGASERPPRPVEDQSEHPRAVELDRLCAERGFGRLGELDDESLAALTAALDEFEVRVSDERRQVYAELDDLTDELVRRYAEQTSLPDDEP